MPIHLQQTDKVLAIVSVLFVTSIGTFLFLPKENHSQRSVLGEVTIAPTPTIEEEIPVTPIPSTVADENESTPTPTTVVTAPPATISETTIFPTTPPEPLLAYTPLTPQTPKIVNSTSGTVTTFSFENLQKDTLYKVNLSSFTADSLAISWPMGQALQWSPESASIKKSELEEVPIDDDSASVEFTNFSGLLAFPQGKSFYIYSEKSLAKISISLVAPTVLNDNFSLQTTGIYNSNSGASYTSLSLKTRDEWGANPSSWDSNSSANIDSPSRLIWYPVYYKAARIIVHHTATAPNTSNPATAVRSIYLYHSYVRGWKDIGYNFLIDQNGTIYEGKLGGDETQGYHAFGAANRMSIGISLIGDFTSTTPTSKARASLIKLMAEKAAFYGFTLKYSDGGLSKWKDISYTVFGHRSSYQWNSGSNSWSVNQTACPGNSFMPILPGLVQEAENYRKANFTQLKQLAADTNASFAQPHEQGTIIVKYNVPENTTPEIMETYVPSFSGITSHTVEGNVITYHIESTIVTHPNNETEYLVVPMGWTGYDGEYATFSTPFIMNGPEDRAKTLLKIFKLDPRVQAADLKHYLSIQ